MDSVQGRGLPSLLVYSQYCSSSWLSLQALVEVAQVRQNRDRLLLLYTMNFSDLGMSLMGMLALNRKGGISCIYCFSTYHRESFDFLQAARALGLLHDVYIACRQPITTTGEQLLSQNWVHIPCYSRASHQMRKLSCTSSTQESFIVLPNLDAQALGAVCLEHILSTGIYLNTKRKRKLLCCPALICS